MDRYTRPAILLHWLTALLIVAAFILGLVMVDIPGITPAKLKYFSWHKWMGVTVLGLACLRLLWRLAHKPPAYPAAMPAWQIKAADGVHALLYILIFAVPVSGYLYTTAANVPVVYLGLFRIPALFEGNAELKALFKPVHYWLVMSMAATVAVHVLGALKHQFIDRDGLLRRMLP